MAYPRVSGRLGNTLDLNLTFFRNGRPTDPYAVRRISIYRSAVQPENLVGEIDIPDPSDPSYPSPLSQELDTNGNPKPGVFHLLWDVPSAGIPVPDIFFDVWSYLGTDPGLGNAGTTGAAGTDITNSDLVDDESLWQSCCEKFWLYDDGFFCDAGLENIRFGFEPIDEKFYQPEVRTLEVGLMPLPLYDFDYNKIAPIIPRLEATISLMTDNCETLLLDAPMRIGLRQGTHRSDPFTLQYTLDTTVVLKGCYKYQITLHLPNGETRVSPKFNLQVS